MFLYILFAVNYVALNEYTNFVNSIILVSLMKLITVRQFILKICSLKSFIHTSNLDVYVDPIVELLPTYPPTYCCNYTLVY